MPVSADDAETLALRALAWIAGQDDLLLIAFDDGALGPELRYEPARGGTLFPHLYAPLDPAAALWVEPLPRDAAGNHLFPDLAS